MRTLRAAFIVMWPFLASALLTAVMVASVIVVKVTLDQRDSLLRQSEQVEELVRAQRAETRSLAERTERQRVESADRLATALVEVERITEERYDALLAQIAVLLGRPVLTAPGVPSPQSAPSPPHRGTAPTTTTAAPAPPPTTPTTTPDKKQCERRPGGPRC